MRVLSADTSTFNVQTYNPPNTARVYEDASASSVTCFNSPSATNVGAPGYSTIAVDIKCNNLWYDCPLRYNVGFLCISTDPCAGVSCGAYGYCSNGGCVCSNGYSGPSCSVPPNPCANVNCGSHGSCVSGTCSCTGGYSGGGVRHRTAGCTSVTRTHRHLQQ